MTQKIVLHKDYIPFGLAVASERDAVGAPVFKYGFNTAASTSNDTIWLQEGVYTWPTSAAVLDITSTDINDDNSTPSTGALTVVLEGLDANYAEITETVEMNGQTAALTTNSYLRLHRMYVGTAGSSLTNEGIIYASTGTQTTGTPDVATTIRSTIGAGEGQTLQAFYTVPAGYTAYLYNVSAGSVDGTNATTITLRSRTEGGAFRTKEKFVVFKGTVDRSHDIPLVFTEKTDIEMLAASATGTTDVAGSFDMVLLPN